MGDLDFTVRIRTDYQDPTSLREALGRSVKQGCFRVPARLSGGRPFVLVLATRGGTAAVKGTAEVVSQEGETTWVRFLSSSDRIAEADVVLDDVDISVFPPEAITHPIRALRTARAAQGSQAALAKNPKTGQSAPIQASAKTKTGQTSAVTSALLPAIPATRTGQSAVAALPAAPRPGTGQQRAASAAPGAEPPGPAVAPMTPEHDATPAQNAARRVARYSQSARSRLPSRHPRGLQMMPALAIDQAPPAQPPTHHHTLDDSHMGYGLPLGEVPSSSSASPLPAPLSSNTAPLPEAPRAAAERPVTGRGEALMPLVSVVPWWNQPPEAPRPAHDEGAHRDREDGDATRAAPLAQLREPSNPHVLAHPAARRAATMSGAIDAVPPARGEHAMAAAPLVDVAALEEPAEPPVTRRLLLGSIALAVTCTAVAVAAIWWAIDLRTSSREASSRAASPAMSSRRPATPMRPNGSALGGTASRAPASAPPPAAAPPATAAAAVPAAAPQPCQLRVSSNANPAQIFLDGQPRGESPALLEAPCGPLTLELRHARYASATRQLEAVPGVITDVELKMARPLVTIKVTSRPPGATVRLNGRDVGRTPLTTEVPAFERYTVVWSNRAGATATQLVYPQTDDETFSATLLSSP
jgi:PEGA domain